MIYLTAIGQPPCGSCSVHMYTQTMQETSQHKQCKEHKNIQNNTKKYIAQHNNQEECGPCPVFAGFTLAFALQLRKKHGKTSVRVGKTSVRVEKSQSGQKNLSHGRKKSVRVEKPQSGQRNLSQATKPSVRVEKTQSGQRNLSQVMIMMMIALIRTKMLKYQVWYK